MPTFERPTVLLVEDDRATREMFGYALRIGGFDVLLAGDGFTALRLIEEQVEERLPDVVVLDLNLPQLSGRDVHQEILAHAETRVIPVIVVTGTESDPLPKVFRTLRKPVAPDVLVAVVQEALAPPTEPPAGA